jgi:uncharacterized protein YdaU (DUF1376 family)
MHYFNFNIGDYASHTRHLSLLEDLAYRRLIDAYYLAEKPFTGSPADIAKDIGMTSQIEEVYYVLTKFFEQSDDGTWFNKRCDEEIAHYHGKHQQAIRAGKASAEARLSKRSTSVQLTNNQEPITKNHIKPIPPIGFDLFWDAYDKKVGKPNALKEWSKAKIDEDLLKVVVEQAKKCAQAVEKQFRKDPERWIKYKGWEDEIIVNNEPKSKELPLGTEKQIEEAYRVECGGNPSTARFNSYFEMKKFILDFRDKKKRVA